jgi:hypothetical protein
MTKIGSLQWQGIVPRVRIDPPGRVVLGLSYEELAAALEFRSADAARMATKRAILRMERLVRTSNQLVPRSIVVTKRSTLAKQRSAASA